MSDLKLEIENISALAKEIKFAAGAMRPAAAVPILNYMNVAVERVGERNCLLIRSTDLDYEHSILVPCIENGIRGSGAANVPAKRFSEMIEAIAGGGSKISLTVEGSKAIVRRGRARWQIPVLDTPFPDPLESSGGGNFVLTAEEALSLCDKLSYAICDVETRYYICGINIKSSGDFAGPLVCAATDGHKLARMNVSECDTPCDIILPTKAVHALRSLASACKPEDKIDVAFNEDKISFCATFGTRLRCITSKLVDGSYPEYKKLIPEPCDNSFTVSASELLDAVKTLKASVDDFKMEAIGIYWNVDKHAKEINLCLARENGESIVPVWATVKGAGCFAAQADYLIETVQAIGEDIVSFSYTLGEPVRVIGVDDASEHVAIIMPLSVPTWDRGEGRS